MKLRIQISKEKEIRFISHLEYLRSLERAIRRSKLPVAYSEGFNPHLKLSLASALGVGVVSYTEFAEIELAEAVDVLEGAQALSAALPQGIRLLAADVVESSRQALMAQAGGAAYRVTVPCKNAEALAAAVAAYNERLHLSYRKSAPKLKVGFKEIDVKFFIPRLTLTFKDAAVLLFDCKITAQGSMKAIDLLQALKQEYELELALEQADIERLRLYRYSKDGRKLPMLDKRTLIILDNIPELA